MCAERWGSTETKIESAHALRAGAEPLYHLLSSTTNRLGVHRKKSASRVSIPLVPRVSSPAQAIKSRLQIIIARVSSAAATNSLRDFAFGDMLRLESLRSFSELHQPTLLV